MYIIPRISKTSEEDLVRSHAESLVSYKQYQVYTLYLLKLRVLIRK